MDKKLLELFMKKELQKTNQIELRIEQVIKKKSNELYLNWNGTIKVK